MILSLNSPPASVISVHYAPPKALSGPSRNAETRDRVRHDRVDKSGTITLRVHSHLAHRRRPNPRRNPRHLLIQDLDVRIANAITGDLLRELTIDPDKDHQPQTQK